RQRQAAQIEVLDHRPGGLSAGHRRPQDALIERLGARRPGESENSDGLVHARNGTLPPCRSPPSPSPCPWLRPPPRTLPLPRAPRPSSTASGACVGSPSRVPSCRTSLNPPR